MKDLLYSTKARYAATFLAVLCAVATVCCAFGSYIAFSLGMYSSSWSEIKEASYERIQKTYSMKIFGERETNAGCLDGTNMEYGIIKEDSKKYADYKAASVQIDYGNPESYLYQNFDEITPDAETFVMEFHDEDVVEYQATLFGSLLNAGYVWQEEGFWEEYDERVEEICYNHDDGVFYYKTKNYLIPVQRISFAEDEDGVGSMGSSYVLNKNKRYEQEEVPALGKKLLDTDRFNNWANVFFDFLEVDIGEIVGTDNEILTSGEKITENTKNAETVSVQLKQLDLDEDEAVVYQEGTGEKRVSLDIYWEADQDPDNSTYWILSAVKEPLDSSTNDLFVQQMKLIRFLFDFRYLLVIGSAVFAMLCLVAVIFCCRNIAKEAAGGKEKEKFYYRIPLLILGIGILCLFGLCGMALENGIAYLCYATGGKVVFAILGLLCVITAGFWLMLMALLNLIYRFQAKILWKYTVLRYIAHALRKPMQVFRRNTSLVLRGGLVIGGLSVLQLIVIVQTAYRVDLEIFAFLLYKIVEIGIIFTVLLQMKRLQEGSRQMAQGDLDAKIDTKKLFWEFQKHGEYLNQISDGMAIALQDRMKSERFKTELITNVSHDIKTPLTSIINYIDLMKREQVSDPAIREYLEVLERHSARLKKLIEDLMEASKASTGNLVVNWEECDVNILLTQALGEFEERMKAADLELIVGKQEETACIMADNRHLWRIFDNLMNNICKYAQTGTRVYIDQEVSRDVVSIFFRNTSKYPLNISSEELLERFVRGDDSRNTEGSGLGLSIAQNLVELMKGEMELYIDGDLFKVILRFPKKP